MARERRRHPRIPANLNAVLINKGDIPRGCRVRNLSEQGMLLERGSGGDIGSLKEGDTVEIHISLRRGGDTRKSVTVSAAVRRVDEDSVGVEFLDDGEEIAPLIEFCRDGASGEFETSTSSTGGENRDSRAINYRLSSWSLALLILALCLLIGTYIHSYRISDRLSILETTVSDQASALTQMSASVINNSESQEMLVDLGARVQSLANTVADLEEKLAVAVRQPEAVPDSVEPPAVVSAENASKTGETALAVSREKEETSGAPVEVPTAVAGEGLEPAPELLSGAGGSGLWVINLVSLRDKAAADQFAARARSQGIPIEQNRVEVKGTEFWRVQIPGFSTSDDARTYASTAKKALAIKDVWLIKR